MPGQLKLLHRVDDAGRFVEAIHADTYNPFDGDADDTVRYQLVPTTEAERLANLDAIDEHRRGVHRGRRSMQDG